MVDNNKTVDNNYKHTSVLLDEAVKGLNIRDNGIYIDGTFGRGGHSRLILSQLGPEGRLIAIDRDPEAIEAAKQITDPRFSIVHGPFSDLAHYVRDLAVLTAYCWIWAFHHHNLMMLNAASLLCVMGRWICGWTLLVACLLLNG